MCAEDKRTDAEREKNSENGLRLKVVVILERILEKYMVKLATVNHVFYASILPTFIHCRVARAPARFNKIITRQLTSVENRSRYVYARERLHDGWMMGNER